MNLVDLKKKWQNKFHDLVHAVVDDIHDIDDDILDFLTPAAKTIKENGGKILIAIALDAVKYARDNGKTLNGAGKFDMALEYATTELQKQFIPFVVSAVETAVQNAYEKMMAE